MWAVEKWLTNPCGGVCRLAVCTTVEGLGSPAQEGDST